MIPLVGYGLQSISSFIDMKMPSKIDNGSPVNIIYQDFNKIHESLFLHNEITADTFIPKSDWI